MKQVSVIGMGLTPEDLTAKHLKLIKDADVLVGGKRHLEYFKDCTADKKEIGKDIKSSTREERRKFWVEAKELEKQ